ncbi:hypothetical protein YTPLAS72_10630 [Nitrospira sp.]|nr:hypothetical protein YTPLAS72_10630 [Nitrospira sp.]
MGASIERGTLNFSIVIYVALGGAGVYTMSVSAETEVANDMPTREWQGGLLENGIVEGFRLR